MKNKTKKKVRAHLKHDIREEKERMKEDKQLIKKLKK